MTPVRSMGTSFSITPPEGTIALSKAAGQPIALTVEGAG
jgi:hypothetical protein